jgi:hypothetical protein
MPDTNGSSITNNNIDIQVQFELCVELRRFINIDLFQRGLVVIEFSCNRISNIYNSSYYQIRCSVKFQNKQTPIKVLVDLENNQNNQNLSGNLFIRVSDFKRLIFIIKRFYVSKLCME